MKTLEIEMNDISEKRVLNINPIKTTSFKIEEK